MDEKYEKLQAKLNLLQAKNELLKKLEILERGNEILSYNISKKLKIDIVIDTIDKLIKNNSNILRKDSFIHSDQGLHYTSPIFQN